MYIVIHNWEFIMHSSMLTFISHILLLFPKEFLNNEHFNRKFLHVFLSGVNDVFWAGVGVN